MTEVLSAPPEATPGTPRCPICGHKTGAASGVWTDQSPRPGDVSLCLYCGGVIVFEDGLESHPITPEEEEGLSNSLRAQIERVQEALQRAGRPDED